MALTLEQPHVSLKSMGDSTNPRNISVDHHMLDSMDCISTLEIQCMKVENTKNGFSELSNSQQVIKCTPKRKRLSLKQFYEKLESGEFKCKCCCMTYKKQNTMSQHVKLKHTEPQELCPHGCKEKFHTRQQVKQHIINVHTNEKTFKCEYCNHTSKWQGNLDQHMKRCKSNPENN